MLVLTIWEGMAGGGGDVLDSGLGDDEGVEVKLNRWFAEGGGEVPATDSLAASGAEGVAIFERFFVGAGGSGLEVLLSVEFLDLKKEGRGLVEGIFEGGATTVGILVGSALAASDFAREDAVDVESLENKSETLVFRFTGVGRGMLD